MSVNPSSIAWRPMRLAPAEHPLARLGADRRSCHPAGFAGSNQPVPRAAPDEAEDELANDSEEDKLARLLAVLFLAKEPLNSRKLAQYSRLADGTEARTLVTRLNRQLDASGRAFRVEQVAGGHQIVTRPKFAKWLRRLEYLPGEVRLSAPAMETLAVVAYRQPVLRADVEAVRGVSCGEILSQLLSRDLVRIGGRSNDLGRPYLYGTTKRFLQLFGLRSLDELPATDILVGPTSPEQSEQPTDLDVDPAPSETEEEHLAEQETSDQGFEEKLK